MYILNIPGSINLISGQAEDNGGSLTSPVDHEVEVGVIEMEHRTGED